MNPSDKHVAGEWPEVEMARCAQWGIEHVEDALTRSELERETDIEFTPYVPKARLEEVEAEREQMAEIASGAIVREGHLQAVLDHLTQPEAVSAARKAFWRDFMFTDAIQAALEEAKRQVGEGRGSAS